MKHSHLFKSLCLGLCLTIAVASFAQTKKHYKTPEEKAQAITDKMKTELSLTDDQYQKVHTANVDFVSKTWELKKGGDANTQQAKDKIKPIKKEYHTAIKGILTPEQLTKFEAMKNEKEDKTKKREE